MKTFVDARPQNDYRTLNTTTRDCSSVGAKDDGAWTKRRLGEFKAAEE